MRILRLIDSLDPAIGGPAAGIRSITPALAALGHETTCVSLDPPSAELQASVPSATVVCLGPSLGSYGFGPRLSPWLRRELPRHDGVIVHGLWQYPGVAARRAARRAARPYWVLPHGMLDPWFGRSYPIKHFKKSLYWRIAQRGILRDATAVLYTCERERDLARTAFPGYVCRERVVAYGAADAPAEAERQIAAFRRRVPEWTGRSFFLFLGRIHEKKGIDLLLQAYALWLGEAGVSTPAPVLVVAGPCSDARLLDRLRRLGDGLPGQGRVLWPGMLTGDAKWGALRAASLFVLPSHQENFGIAVAEALACGTPVAISDQVNICREIAADGAGLVETDTLPGTLQLLRRWQALPEEARGEMRAAARRSFLRRFEISGAAASLIRTLEETAPPPPSRARPAATMRPETPGGICLLHVTDSLDPKVGGPPAVIRALSPAMAELGHRSTCVTTDPPGRLSALAVDGAAVVALGPPIGSYGFSPALRPWLTDRAGDFDVLVVHGLWKHHGPATRRAALLRGVPYVVFPHGMLDPWFRRAYPFKHLKKLAYWWVAQRRVLRDAAAVLYTCERERELARATFPGYRAQECTVSFGTADAPPSTSTQVAAFRDRLPGLEGREIFLFLGRIHEKKGVDLLLGAYRELLRTPAGLEGAPVLVVAGPCADRRLQLRLRQLADSMPKGGLVLWPGMLEGETKWGALRAASLFVLPSHQENFGIAVAEALACGTPVAISDQVNICREIAADGAGFVEPDDLAGTLRLLQRWRDLPADGRARMRAAARACFLRRFEIHRAAESLVSTLRAIGVQEVATRKT